MESYSCRLSARAPGRCVLACMWRLAHADRFDPAYRANIRGSIAVVCRRGLIHLDHAPAPCLELEDEGAGAPSEDWRESLAPVSGWSDYGQSLGRDTRD